MFNALSSNVGNQEDVRANEVLKGLEAAAKMFGENNWSIFEIFTYATKIVEIGVEHAKNNKVGYPKALSITAATGEKIEFTVRKPQSAAQKEINDKLVYDQTVAGIIGTDTNKKPH